jgi:hypothetical protein
MFLKVVNRNNKNYLTTFNNPNVTIISPNCLGQLGQLRKNVCPGAVGAGKKNLVALDIP